MFPLTITYAPEAMSASAFRALGSAAGSLRRGPSDVTKASQTLGRRFRVNPVTIEGHLNHLTHHHRMNLKRNLLSLLALAACPIAYAGTEPSPSGKNPAPTTEAKPATLGETLENLGRLYKDDENDILQELWLLGRYHGQYHWSDGASNDDGWEDRRFRIGAQAKLLRKLTLHAQMVSGSDFEPFYGGFTELWASWQFSEALNLTLGQQKHRFTLDRNVSSRYLNYMERSLMTNQFGLDYTPAVTLSGKIDGFSYYTGLFSNATGTDMGEAFTDLDSGWSYIATGIFDLGKPFGMDTAHVHLSYIHSEANENASHMNRFDDGVAAALSLTKGSASLVTEVTGGIGGANGSAWGLNLQPGVFLTDNLQLVGRYQLAGSESDDGLKAQRRYERNVGLATGDLYQAGYMGLNYYVAKHRIKLMTGVEYSTLGGQDQWTAWTGVRIFWGPHSKGPFPMAQTLPGAW